MISPTDTGDRASRAYRGLVLLFYMCFFLLSSSGRLGSSDAGAQLQAAVLLVTTGRLGASLPPANEGNGGVGLWRRGINGRYYEVHDIGNAVLMVPAAWAGRRLSRAPSATDFDSPPLLCRVGVSLTYALVSALGCFFMFRLFALKHGDRVAFLLSLLLPATTIFWAYSKTAWDVMGACCAMCAALYAAALVLRGGTGTRALVHLAVCMAIVSSFRNSLAPFLILGTVSLLYICQARSCLARSRRLCGNVVDRVIAVACLQRRALGVPVATRERVAGVPCKPSCLAATSSTDSGDCWFRRITACSSSHPSCCSSSRFRSPGPGWRRTIVTSSLRWPPAHSRTPS